MKALLSVSNLARSLAFVLATVSLADAQTRSVERNDDGAPVCGLGKDFHAGRRARLRAELGRGVVVCRGLPETRDYTRFHQDKVFWYLTGVESPDAALVMDVESGQEILFLPPAEERREKWDGELWDAEDEWVVELTGFEDVRPIQDLESTLRKLASKDTTVWISTQPHVALSGCFDRAAPFDRRQVDDPFDGRPNREGALRSRLRELLDADVQSFTGKLDAMRRVKTTEEVAAMQRASRSGALAMAEAIRSTRPGLGEWDLEALMSWIQIREGAAGPAYHGIVGSGPNSLVLHYSASNRALRDGEVLLIDYGCQVDHYTTDITRTWPVGGTFSERQAELYDAVLEAQLAGIAAVRPGATMGAVREAAEVVLREKGLGDLIRHGTCHYIGMEVHDVGENSAELVPGVCFTVEPGVYEEETGIGIRIEDVVVVTQDGCRVLSDGVPKERAAVERLMGEPGIIDRLFAQDD